MLLVKKYILLCYLLLAVAVSCSFDENEIVSDGILVSFFEKKVDENKIRDPVKLGLDGGYEYEILDREKYNIINIYYYGRDDYADTKGLGGYRISSDTLFLIRDTENAYYPPDEYSVEYEDLPHPAFLQTQYKFSKDVNLDKYHIYLIRSTIEPHEPEFIRKKFF